MISSQSRSQQPDPSWKLILVGYDGSNPAIRAVSFAMNLAVLTHAEILLLHAVEHSGDVIEPVTDEEIQYRQRAYKEVLDTFIQEGLRHGVTIQSVTQEGNPVQAILDTATMKNADMIVLGTQGRRGAEKVLLGSVSSGVMAGASIPVTLIR